MTGGQYTGVGDGCQESAAYRASRWMELDAGQRRQARLDCGVIRREAGRKAAQSVFRAGNSGGVQGVTRTCKAIAWKAFRSPWSCT